MASGLRKFVLVAHLTFSMGWIGAALAYLALGVSATRRDPATVRAAWIAMELTGWYVIVPLALGSLLTGVVLSLGTRWGLFRHYWVVISLVLTTGATVVLLVHMPDVTSRAEVARRATDSELLGLGSDLAHPGIGLLVLLLIAGLNTYKPRGMTRYGWRKTHRRGPDPGPS